MLPANLENDGLTTPEVGAWSEDKYKLVNLYANLFATGMKSKWDERVYIDLFAGAGRARIKGRNKIVLGSPLIALTVNDPFDRYILCESDSEKLNALKKRAQAIAPQARVEYVLGDCNARVDEIIAKMPAFSKAHRVLSLCFVDPYDIGIKFATTKRLSTHFVDFLMLLALHMDGNRNYSNYQNPRSSKVDDFLGDVHWRVRWAEAHKTGMPFPKFLAQEYAARMATLGYLQNPMYRMKEVRSDEKNLPLYHLALFSRHERGYDFWDEVLKYSTDQTKLF
ncbi:MAG: three-Cys-motif partner protein TcmP [Acidobacteriales bacterium]|nr:three-Cys-motif partner protein TcmP [Terriglobales bacterium]